MKKINEEANQILDDMMLKMADPATQNIRDVRQTALKAMSEIRSQLSLQLDIMKALYDVQAMADFQREVLEEFDRISPKSRDRIIAALKAKRMLHASVELT